jgi:hypothetical protein
VKAAELQGGALDEAYLALVREAAMTRRLNVSRRETLQALAVERAARPVRRRSGRRRRGPRLTADLEETRMRRIGRFPTFVVHGPAGSRIAVGYRPQAAVEAVFQAVGLME